MYVVYEINSFIHVFMVSILLDPVCEMTPIHDIYAYI